ncbi:GGDEF domain-containing protein [Eubacteriaceae bacterium ES3]|nr:GGDEF domain-containing protein [Eubacteriaceae bacterium ES3]
MINKNLILHEIETLNHWIKEKEITTLINDSRSVIVQIFSAKNEPEWFLEIDSIIRTVVPQATIVGASSMGEILEGRLLTNTTILSFLFLERTQVQSYFIETEAQNEKTLGKKLAEEIETDCDKIAGILVMSTPATTNVADFLYGFTVGRNGSYPVFGGGAGVYDTGQKPLVTLNQQFSSNAVVALVFSGDEIFIKVHTYLGWESLSKELTLTETDGLWLKTIDDQPAFDVYHRYLNIHDDENFFLNVLEFPLLVERNGITYAKTPISVNEDKAIKFLADIRQGESARIGYGNPAVIIENARDIQERVQSFNPQAIFIFSCTCRRFLLQSEVELETKAFEKIAPTSGFYTHGEIYSPDRNVMILNATMVAVSMKENISESSMSTLKGGHAQEAREAFKNNNVESHQLSFSKTKTNAANGGEQVIEKVKEEQISSDPFIYQNNLIISRLVNFIKAVTDELEVANQTTIRLAERDYLTQVYNRMKGHKLLVREVSKCNQQNLRLSILMIDADSFKKVNDTFGHNVGDEILIQLTRVLSNNIRNVDILSRWGGEEFLIIMPNLESDDAIRAGERLRAALEQTLFTHDIKQTASFGVATYKIGESPDELIDRADKALYEAKKMGRNRVVFKSVE